MSLHFINLQLLKIELQLFTYQYTKNNVNTIPKEHEAVNTIDEYQ